MLDIVTKKEITKEESRYYYSQKVGIYNKTPYMNNAESDCNYYALSYGGCACGYHNENPGNGHILISLLTKCVKCGELILFFYWDDGDYNKIENDVHSYINRTKKVKIKLQKFLTFFMTEKFEYNNVVFIITE